MSGYFERTSDSVAEMPAQRALQKSVVLAPTKRYLP